MARFAFGVILKAPREGYVKTRLTPTLTSSEAALLHTAFVRDTCDNIAAIRSTHLIDGIAVYTPDGAQEEVEPLLPRSFRLVAQRGDGFGERLLLATADLLALGYDGAFLVDSDSPTVPTRYLEQAVDLLSTQNDCAVLGPCDDGGYYLLGLKRPHAALFDRITWSTDVVAAQTRQRAREIGLPLWTLPTWYDVDDRVSLNALACELSGSTARTEPGYPAPHSRRYVSELVRNGLFEPAIS